MAVRPTRSELIAALRDVLPIAEEGASFLKGESRGTVRRARDVLLRETGKVG